jgi:hypothetical protein
MGLEQRGPKPDVESWFSHENTSIIIKKEIAESSEDANLRRFKDKALFLLSIALVFLAFVYSLIRLISNPADTWAMALLPAIITGLLGYLTGKKTH